MSKLFQQQRESRRARSAVMASIHEAAGSLRKVKAIKEATMRVFDKICLTPTRPAQHPTAAPRTTAKHSES